MVLSPHDGWTLHNDETQAQAAAGTKDGRHHKWGYVSDTVSGKTGGMWGQGRQGDSGKGASLQEVVLSPHDGWALHNDETQAPKAAAAWASAAGSKHAGATAAAGAKDGRHHKWGSVSDMVRTRVCDLGKRKGREW